MTRPFIASFQGHSPRIHASAFVAPTAAVVGDVVLGEEASVWYGAVIRGDVGAIRIGGRSNIQDGCVLHVTAGGTPLTVGAEVTVGHRAILHGATIEDRCLIGMGSVLLDGCVIGEESLVGAGSVVLEGTRVPPRSFIAGVPAKVKGPIPAPVHARLKESAAGYVRLAREHAALRDAG
ncbi:MAG TPA: gamma carbonic anhydrase family protein [Candidatus Limnocylindrales bacterium]|jgi:carbonic anhydrase/acetyltransferase-like protein (isoleucine patch superfamily)|nr:gamma carbonic anhydrase family protein [Candidatus Limnocylindrales bacterium]